MFIFFLKNLNDHAYGWFVEWSIGKEIIQKDIQDIIKLFNNSLNNRWEKMEHYLDAVEKYYVGIPEKQWLKWFIHSIPLKKSTYALKEQIYIKNLAKIGEKKLDVIMRIFYKKYNVQNYKKLVIKIQTLKAIELIRDGKIKNIDGIKISLKPNNYYKLIYKRGFKMKSEHNSKRYFEKTLFPGYSIEEIFNLYNKTK